MLNISDELKLIYKNDVIPLTTKNVHKKLELYFPELNLTITNDKIVGENFSLTESICLDSELTFGGCESSVVKVEVADITQDLKGRKMIVTQTVNNIYTMPLGTFIVDSVIKTNDLRFKDITAYDESKYILEKDVTEWYNLLSFPLTLKAFRESFFNYIGLEIEVQTLVNDLIIIEKTIEPESIKALDIAIRIGELNGSFGQMTRNNKFKYTHLKPPSLYPSEDLFPSEELFPSESGEYIGTAGYISTKYEEYIVKGIDCLQIRQDESDTGSVEYDNENYKNPYIITGNFLVYGKSAIELKTITRNIFNEIKGLDYRSHTTTLIGLPYIEVGDSVAVMKKTDTIESFIFTRTLSGVQVLRDTISAKGDEYRDNTVSLNTEIKMLKGKSLAIEKNVDGLGIKVTDLEKGYTEVNVKADGISAKVSDLVGNYSTISQTVNGISTKVSTLEGNYSTISQTVNGISSKVGTLEGNYTSITQSVNSISSRVSGLDGDFSELEQTVDGFTFTNSTGQTRINGSRISTGILDSVSILFTKADSVFFSAGGNSLTGSGYEWRLDSNAFYSAGKSIELNRNNGNIVCSDIYLSGTWANGWGLEEMLKDIYNKLP